MQPVSTVINISLGKVFASMLLQIVANDKWFSGHG